MSSTNKTSLGLNMWEASDKPVRQDFVSDNVIIDETISKLKQDSSNSIVILDEKITKLNNNFPYKAKTEAYYLTNFAEYGGLYYHDFIIPSNDKIPIIFVSVSGVNNFVKTSITGVTATGYRVWADTKIVDAVVNVLVLIPK